MIILIKPSCAVSSTEKCNSPHYTSFIISCPSLKRSLATSGVSISQNSQFIDKRKVICPSKCMKVSHLYLDTLI